MFGTFLDEMCGVAIVYDLIIRDATILNSSRRLVADIAVEGGKIVEVGGPIYGRTRLELQGIGRFLMPGVIDTRVRAGRPGEATGHEWETLSRAALGAGSTTLFDLPDHRTPVFSRKALAEARAATKGSVVDIAHWIQATEDNLAEAADAVSSGEAIGAFIRAGIGSDQLGTVDLDAVPEMLGALPGRVGVTIEDGDVLRKARRKLGDADPSDDLLRPERAEAEALGALVEWLKASPHPVHLSGLSTSNGFNVIDSHRGDIPLSIGVSPQHLFLSIETQKIGGLAKNDPPVRHELDRRALWSAVKRGRIDLFHSAHVPLSKQAKSGSYADRPSGLPGVDTLLPLLVGAVKNGRLGVEQLVQMCSEAPARLFGLESKGRIEVGADADLLLVREGNTRRLRPAPNASGVEWSPFLGREVGLLPEIVVARGKVVAREGVLTGDVSLGSFVGRGG
jgi:dihydroorotase